METINLLKAYCKRKKGYAVPNIGVYEKIVTKDNKGYALIWNDKSRQSCHISVSLDKAKLIQDALPTFLTNK